MKRYLKNISMFFLTAFLTSSTLNLYARPTVYIEQTYSQMLSRDTILHTTTQITSSGFLEIAVLEIPLFDPMLEVSVFNAEEFGRRTPTIQLLAASGALAGVNGDFFGMTGTHTVPLGTEIINGHMSISSGQNNHQNNNASFLLSQHGAFIDYVRPHVQLLLGYATTIHVPHINKIADLAWPSFITYGYMQNTASLSARFPNSYKVVVQNNIITYVSQMGEIVNVPEDGFVIIFSSNDFYWVRHNFYIGNSAEKQIRSNINLNDIVTAISGGNRILYEGQIVHHTGSLSTARHPRTILGLNKARDTLYLMTIEGRTHSIGASLAEAAAYIRDFGAHYAINLDGGGSTSMAARIKGQTYMQLVNTPSDGSQRAVINAIGVIDHSTLSEVTSIIINSQPNVGIGIYNNISITGFDDFFNPIGLSLDQFDLQINNGRILNNGRFVPETAGDVTITAHLRPSLGAVYTTQSFTAVAITEIVSDTTSIIGNTQLGFFGIDNNGNRVNLENNQLMYEVHPQTLGTFINGAFTAMGQGMGWARVFMDTASLYIPIIIPRQAVIVDNFDGSTNVGFGAYPGGITGSASYSMLQYISGGLSLLLSYNFAQAEHTQIAYVDFLQPHQVNTVSYILAVYGNNSGHWLRGNVIDAKGYSFTIDFTQSINFYGWQDLTANVPNSATMPVSLQNIYVASLHQREDGSYELFFDNLRIRELTNDDIINTPIGSRVQDALFVQNMGARPANQLDISFIGPMTFTGGQMPSNFIDTRRMTLAAASSDISAIFYGGVANISNDTDVFSQSHPSAYNVMFINNLHVIQMTARNGGFAASSLIQWARLQNDLNLAPTNNIVIHMDFNPFNFRHGFEFDMFHNLLTEQANLGRNIFVVSNGGNNTTSQILDGVRYINLATLFTGSNLNTDFTMLRFRVTEDSITYSLEQIF